MFDSRVQVRDSLLVNITLAKDVEDFLKEQVRLGVCPSPDQLVNDLLRQFREQQSLSFEITSEVEAWLLEAAESPTTDLLHEDFEQIRQRVKSRGIL